ncbi:MAG: type secretion system tube protein Hcp [Candidatus Nitrosotenuis sp.]|nr:type secretion system tube protein Hcp [Candidatus Nitrosotenuis sp.]
MSNQIILLSILFVTILGFSFNDAYAAVDMFIKIKDIPGESSDKNHNKEIDILSLSWSSAMQSSRDGAAGKASAEEFSITKYIDKATPKLFESLATGKHIEEATLVVRKAGGNPVEYLKYTLRDIMISSYTTGSSGEDRPTESISFNYGKIEIEYTEINADGTPGKVTVRGWDPVKKQTYCPDAAGTCGDVPAAAFEPLGKDLAISKTETPAKQEELKEIRKLTVPSDEMVSIPIAGEMPSGLYKVKVKYDQEEVESFSVSIVKEKVPVWIKKNGKWWAEKQISDTEFINGIQFMIQQKIILVSGEPTESVQADVPVPEWVRNNAGWWADDLISEEEFVKALEFLIQNGIIIIS